MPLSAGRCRLMPLSLAPVTPLGASPRATSSALRSSPLSSSMEEPELIDRSNSLLLSGEAFASAAFRASMSGAESFFSFEDFLALAASSAARSSASRSISSVRKESSGLLVPVWDSRRISLSVPGLAERPMTSIWSLLSGTILTSLSLSEPIGTRRTPLSSLPGAFLRTLDFGPEGASTTRTSLSGATWKVTGIPFTGCP